MAVRQPRYSKEEFARRGDELYETQVRHQVEADNHGKIVAIDLETGAFEVDASEIVACDRLEAHQPEAQIWIVRIGSRHLLAYIDRLEQQDAERAEALIQLAQIRKVDLKSLMAQYLPVSNAA